MLITISSRIRVADDLEDAPDAAPGVVECNVGLLDDLVVVFDEFLRAIIHARHLPAHDQQQRRHQRQQCGEGAVEPQPDLHVLDLHPPPHNSTNWWVIGRVANRLIRSLVDS